MNKQSTLRRIAGLPLSLGSVLAALALACSALPARADPQAALAAMREPGAVVLMPGTPAHPASATLRGSRSTTVPPSAT